MDTLEEIKQILKELSISQKETDAKFKETDAKFKETDAQMARTDAKLNKASELLGNIGRNNGAVAEEYFYYSMEEKMEMGGIRYDVIKQNIHAMNRQQLEDEFDIVLYNGNSIGLIEVKHKVHPSDINKLITKKATNFRLLFTDYKGYKIYLGIAGFSIPEEVAEIAQDNGVAVLRQKGDLLVMNDSNLKVY